MKKNEVIARRIAYRIINEIPIKSINWKNVQQIVSESIRDVKEEKCYELEKNDYKQIICNCGEEMERMYKYIDKEQKLEVYSCDCGKQAIFREMNKGEHYELGDK